MIGGLHGPAVFNVEYEYAYVKPLFDADAYVDEFRKKFEDLPST